MNKFEQVSSDGHHGEETLSSDVPCWGEGAEHGGPCLVTSHYEGIGPCMGRSNAFWVMVTCDHPLPVDKLTDWQTRLKTFPSSNFFGER